MEGPTGVSRDDLLFAEMVVTQGMTSRERVDECLSILRRLADGGVSPLPRLGELLVQKGYLTPPQTLRVTGGKQADAAETPAQVSEARRDTAKVIGKYVLMERLGSGGMGEVWKAWDGELGRWIALKFLKGADPEEIVRFKREAQTAGKLNHPNVGAVYDVGDHGGRHYIAMQYVAGQTLAAFPRGDRRLLVELMRDAARAVHYAHEQGIIHRDLKPANIMVEGRRVFVMDFGLARRMQGRSSLTASGMMVGTPAYMSPEQARGAIREVDARSDVYALGATLYELLTDTPPFRGEDVISLVTQVVQADPKPVRRLNPAIDRDIETVVMKCLEKEPARRYASAQELAEDLTRWLDGEPVRARPISTLVRLMRKARRHKAMTAALGALAVVLMVAATGFAVQRVKSARYVAELKHLAAQWSTILERKRELRLGKLDPSRARRDLAQAVLAVEPHIREWPDDPVGYYVRARVKMYLGDLESAERDVRAAMRKEADFRPGWVLLGHVLMERYQDGLYGPAETIDERIRELSPLREDAVRAFARGQQLGSLDDDYKRWGLPRTREDEVLDRLARLLHLYARESRRQMQPALEEAAKDYQAEEYALWLGRALESIDWLDRAISWAPGYGEAYADRGQARYLRHEFDLALADCDRAVDLRPNSMPPYFNRSLVRRKSGDLPGAINDLDRAIELRPHEAGLYYDRGNVKQAQGNLAGAIEDFGRAIDLRPNLVEPHFNRANARRIQGNFTGSLPDYDRVIQLKPDFVDAYYNRGVAKRELRDLPGAIADFDRAVELKKDFAEVYMERCAAKEMKGDIDGAIEDCDLAIAFKAPYPEAFLSRGILRRTRGDSLSAQGRRDEAIGEWRAAAADYAKALAQGPADWSIRPAIERELDLLRQRVQ